MYRWNFPSDHLPVIATLSTFPSKSYEHSIYLPLQNSVIPDFMKNFKTFTKNYNYLN